MPCGHVGVAAPGAGGNILTEIASVAITAMIRATRSAADMVADLNDVFDMIAIITVVPI